MTPARLVLCTAPNREVADRLATELVEQRLAACVNVIGSVRSIYRWEGRVERDEELENAFESAKFSRDTLRGFGI